MQASQRFRPMLLPGLAALCAAVAIAGCGSSSGSPNSEIGIGKEGSTLPARVSTTPAEVKTPTSGPLSKEPTVTPPKTPAPAKLETKELITGTGTEAVKGDHVTV